MSVDSIAQSDFSQLALSTPILKALKDVGYETPSPIQGEIIPHIMNGRDVLGQAQTGSGKTAAFALPILSRINLKLRDPQVLVLAPTRELAIQVAEAFHRYAAHIKNFHVLPIYGGQDYRTQLRQLNRGVHVVVGTPGRVMDHMRRGTLKLGSLSHLVLDEADEMLRMGFIDDVEWILDQIPEQRQIALFSATMPTAIRRIAEKHLHDPEHITIKVKTATAETIRQRYWLVSGLHKLDALTRILEAEVFDGMIIFVRTKISTAELAEKLEARGHSTSALNGDIAQNVRERTIENFKKGKTDILVATDVAARGLDLDRVTHVINYDIPYDTEGYIHRIGRTGRAGRTGDAILFVSPRERRLLRAIEKATRKQIEIMELPSTEIINDKRIANFKQRITDTLAADDDLDFFSKLISQYEQEHDIPVMEIAAALAKLAQGDTPLLLKHKPVRQREQTEKRPGRSRDDNQGSRSPKNKTAPDTGMDRFRIEVGHKHGVKPGNIVGAISNEAELDSQHIGRIEIFDNFSTVDLPADMPIDIFNDLKKAWVSGQQLNISKDSKPSKNKTGTKKKRKDAGKPRRLKKGSGKPQ